MKLLNNTKIVVLDDDPTGCQTVHDITVYTCWDKHTLFQAFLQEGNMFFIMTNSRSFSKEKTERVHREIINNIVSVGYQTGKDYIIVSRGDSTLRGHYPLETDVIKKTLEETGLEIDGEIICPFFSEGGRITKDNIHYVIQDNLEIPCAETEFAKDKTFGYSQSHLGKYVEEKTNSQYLAQDLIYISCEDLQEGNIDKVSRQIASCKNNKIIVNCTSYKELEVFIKCLEYQLSLGKHFVFRTAASFVKVLGHLEHRALLLKKHILGRSENIGGLIVVGSHTLKTTLQLSYLRQYTHIKDYEVSVDEILKGNSRDVIKEAIWHIEQSLKQNKTIVIFTQRNLISDSNPQKSLDISVTISYAITEIVNSLAIIPAFVISKGGITAADIATRGMNIKKAIVLGQIEQGVPVWKSLTEGKYYDVPYIIFPGNVGDDTMLLEVYQKLETREVRDEG